jgi:hypothetical protein
MSKHDLIFLFIGGMAGYCFCFLVEIVRLTKPSEPTQVILQREKDPADWWKDC